MQIWVTKNQKTRLIGRPKEYKEKQPLSQKSPKGKKRWEIERKNQEKTQEENCTRLTQVGK